MAKLLVSATATVTTGSKMDVSKKMFTLIVGVGILAVASSFLRSTQSGNYLPEAPALNRKRRELGDAATESGRKRHFASTCVPGYQNGIYTKTAIPGRDTSVDIFPLLVAYPEDCLAVEEVSDIAADLFTSRRPQLQVSPVVCLGRDTGRECMAQSLQSLAHTLNCSRIPDTRHIKCSDTKARAELLLMWRTLQSHIHTNDLAIAGKRDGLLSIAAFCHADTDGKAFTEVADVTLVLLPQVGFNTVSDRHTPNPYYKFYGRPRVVQREAVSIQIIYIRGLSRGVFQRTFIQSRNVVEGLSGAGLAYDFRYYQSVSPRLSDNLRTLLGNQSSNFPHGFNLDQCPLYPALFDKGYHVLMSSDNCTHFDDRPGYNNDTSSAFQCPCPTCGAVGDNGHIDDPGQYTKACSQILLEAAAALHNQADLAFSLTVMASVDGYGSDQDKLLARQLRRSSRWNSTVTVLLSDMGRLPPDSSHPSQPTSSKMLLAEVFNPVLYIILPDGVSRLMPRKAVEILRANTERLTTVGDVYHFLGDILGQSMTSDLCSQSLLTSLPVDRPCIASQLTPPSLSLASHPVPFPNDTIQVAMAELAVTYINGYLKGLCQGQGSVQSPVRLELPSPPTSLDRVIGRRFDRVFVALTQQGLETSLTVHAVHLHDILEKRNSHQLLFHVKTRITFTDDVEILDLRIETPGSGFGSHRQLLCPSRPSHPPLSPAKLLAALALPQYGVWPQLITVHHCLLLAVRRYGSESYSFEAVNVCPVTTYEVTLWLFTSHLATVPRQFPISATVSPGHVAHLALAWQRYYGFMNTRIGYRVGFSLNHN